jgi:predicted TPR repeat methyltransferase
MKMERNDREFFNALAESWDKTRAHKPAHLAKLVKRTRIRTNQSVLDVGCGTGVLLPFLREAAGTDARIVGIDIADNMVKIAAEKMREYVNVSVLRSDIMEYHPAEVFEHVTCLNFFPHIQNRSAFLQQVGGEWLVTGGWLHIFHDLSRMQVNAIHGESETVKEDRLPPCEAVGELLTAAGFTAVQCYEDDTCYFVQGQKTLAL